MSRIHKYHLENTARPVGTSLCGHVAHFSASIVSKVEFDSAPDVNQCKRCIGHQNLTFTPIRRFKRLNSYKSLQYID